MKVLYIIISIALLGMSTAFGQKKTEKLLLGGSGWNKIVIIDKATGKIEWEHPLEKGWECNSVAATPDGNILFSYARGAKVVNREHKELWNIAAPAGCEMQTARILPGGNCLLAWAGHPAVVMEVSSDGKILSRTEYDTGVKRPHSQFRQVNKNTRGNYLVPIISTSEVHEISPEGKLVKITKVEGNPFTVLSSKGKNYWVACGDAHILLEANLENGKVIRRYAERDIEGTNLYFVAGLFPSAKGGIYVCNWQGHSRNAKETNSPQLFEIDKKGKMVWSLNDHEAFGMISAVSTIR